METMIGIAMAAAVAGWMLSVIGGVSNQRVELVRIYDGTVSEMRRYAFLSWLGIWGGAALIALAVGLAVAA
jgi:hypothetical protein